MPKDFQTCIRSINQSLTKSLKTYRSNLASKINLISHTELTTSSNPLFDIFPDPLHSSSFLTAISSNEKVSITRTSNADEAQFARHTLRNQGPISQLSFNSHGKLLLISTEEVSSHFRSVNLESLVWENISREEICESIAGLWSESGLAISSFIPKAYESNEETNGFLSKTRQKSFMGNGNLFEMEKANKETKDFMNLEIPLQNVNHWRNNTRGINFVFSDNKLIVFKVKE